MIFPALGRRTMLVNARKIFRPATMTVPFCWRDRGCLARSAPHGAESKRNWQLTQSIVDTIRDPLVVLEFDMTIVTASKAFLTMFAITEAEARGRRLSELGQHQWDVPALRHLMEKVLPENKPFESFEIDDEFPGLSPPRLQLEMLRRFSSREAMLRLLDAASGASKTSADPQNTGASAMPKMADQRSLSSGSRTACR